MANIDIIRVNVNEQLGNLKVEVFDRTVARPVAGASVIVINPNTQNVIENLFTDSSGQTLTIQLPAPPEIYSLEENQPKPYSEYNLLVSADGYEDEQIIGVQIFAGSTAIQSVYLGTQTDVVNITAPVLWGDYPEKLPEEEVKQLPPETGFVILDRVVIPEYIVVHNGVPSANATNYYVTYKDYIKNVASGEIYSTWPVEAIKANVLAINSFTLNRVYTEWYRNRGYDFTITNSTRYDQYFSYGRTIYESISDIVDDLFTTYIKREGQRQPLFAQYCDGKNVQCPGWMTQWGSAELAEDGLRAIEILRYFYGNDVYLNEAEKVTGIPLSYAGEVLSVGSSGNDVRTIQQQLNSIASTYSAIPRLKVDGIFGENTRLAVEAFQKIFNLPVTGAVDFATWYDISELYVAIEKLAEL
jgi:hypothetical protein